MEQLVHRLRRAATGLARGQRGLAGLEGVAMVMFSVLGAGMLAYMVLNGGIASSEKSKASLDQALKVSTNADALTGQITAVDIDGDRIVDQIVFQLGNLHGRDSPIDFTATADSNRDGMLSDEANKSHRTTMTVYTSRAVARDVAWKVEPLGRDDGDAILEPGEMFRITLDVSGLPQPDRLKAYDTFTVELKTVNGGAITFSRTLPDIKSTNTFLSIR